jgi:hypothetical protein
VPAVDGTVSLVVRRLVAEIIRAEYQQFRSVYMDTVNTFEAMPREPTQEAFNAFDHFVRAITDSYDFDFTNSDAPERNLESIFTNIARGQRHLLRAMEYCILYQWYDILLRIVRRFGTDHTTAVSEALKSGVRSSVQELEAKMGVARKAAEDEFNKLDDTASPETIGAALNGPMKHAILEMVRTHSSLLKVFNTIP